VAPSRPNGATESLQQEQQAALLATEGPERPQVSFKPEISATYGLAIMLQGIQLQGSPFKIRVRNDETIAGNCRLYGSSLAVGTAGEVNSFCIQGSAPTITVMSLCMDARVEY